MKPLAFQFREFPKEKSLDFSSIKYDKNLNLSIDKISKLPAVNCLNMQTETFTKADGESLDSDASYSAMSQLLSTQTRTYTSTEETDNDRDRSVIESLMATTTITESGEDTDQDKTFR